ncbi:MAG: sugar phosphate isomerase/epimerase family protein [bacterium]
MTHIKLGINAGFALNRFPEPEVWLKIVGEDLGLRYAQFVVDLLNPYLPHSVLIDGIRRIRENAERYNVRIYTVFTDTYTRVNHLMHPDPDVREAWFQWYKDYISLASALDARGCGSHFGILSVKDYSDPRRRELVTSEAIRYWQRLSEFAAKMGLEFLLFEPMSIPREMAHTIDSAKELHQRVNDGAAIPILLCLDVDHGDVGSEDPRDTDPYSWLRELAHLSPVIHIKQSSQDKGGHWPFTEEHNRVGAISPPKVISAIEESGARDVVLAFEISHRERYPTEYRVLEDLKESVSYWRRYVRD